MLYQYQLFIKLLINLNKIHFNYFQTKNFFLAFDYLCIVLIFYQVERTKF